MENANSTHIRSALLVTALAAGMVLVASASGDAGPRPIALTASDPAILTGPDVTREVTAGRVSLHRMMGSSTDKAFTSGIYAAEAGTGSIDSYPVDEFMYFVSGYMVLSSSDGTVIRLKAGDAVHVPRGWKGTWTTTGYTKLYTVYDSAKR